MQEALRLSCYKYSYIKLFCLFSDLEDYISCALDFATGGGCLIQFKNQTSKQNSALKCKEDCFIRGFQFSEWYNNYWCFCGDERVSSGDNNILEGVNTNTSNMQANFPAASSWCSCQPSTIASLHTGQTHCTKLYISGAIPALPTVKLGPLNIVSTRENTILSAKTDISISSYCWNFGDSTDLCVQNNTSVSHNFALTGTYTITLTMMEGNGTFVVNFPLTVQSEVSVSELILDHYADVEKELPLYVEVTSGSDTQVQWSRSRILGSTEYGMF